MKKISPLNYAYSIGKIRALERFLIKSEVFQEAIAASPNEALRLFVESGFYSDELLQIKDSEHLEAVFNKELLQLKRLISDLLLDKALSELLDKNILECGVRIIKIYPSEFLSDYISHVTDMHNIKTFLRLYIFQEPEAKLKNALIYEGFMQKEFFLRLYSQDLSHFLNRLEYIHKGTRIINYATYLTAAVRKLEKESSFISLEKAMNDFLIEVLKPAKYISFGPEPVLAYYFAKVNEINLMRLVILAKLNDLSGELIKERLNSVYA